MIKIARTVAALSALALFASTADVGAQEYPRKPVELVVPFSQGGGTDRVARIFAAHAGDHLGGEIFVRNRTGGSGAVGFSYGANARPDGHVLTTAATTITVAPHTVAGYPVTYENFTPICLLAALPMTLAVKADSPYATIDDFMAASKTQDLKIGAGGAGTNNYLAGVAVAKAAGTEVTMVPYGGAGPALVALLGGHVDASMADISEVLQYVEGGQVRVLVVLGDEKVEAYPDAPTTASKGWTANVASFRGILAPNDIPDAVKEKLVATCKATAEDPDFIAEMNKFGIDVADIRGDEFGDWLKKQHETYAGAAKAAGVVPQ